MFIILWAPSLRRWLTSFMRFRKYMVPITTSKTMNSFQRYCLLPAATKLWPRLCFYTCVWFCSQGGSPGRENPPGANTPPPEQTPPQQGEPLPPGTRQSPRTRQTRPPWSRHPRPPRSGRPPGADPPDQADPPPPGSRLKHTVNERPVRILLECILVVRGSSLCVRLILVWLLPTAREGNVFTGACLSTIGLMDTGSLLGLVMVRLVRILLECFLVVDDFGAEKSARRNRCSSKPNSWSTVFSVCRMSVGCVLAATLFLPAATKLWSRLCFYTCLWFCPRGGLQAERTPLPGRTPPGTRQTPPRDQADPSRPGRPPHPWTRQTPQTRQTMPPQTRQTPPRDQADTPLDQADPPPTRQIPPDQADPPPPGPSRTPPQTKENTPPGTRQIPPDQADPSPREADSRIRSTSGRYASYWNAFLFM